MPNDNIHKEEEKTSSEALSEPGDEGKQGDEEISESPVIVVSKSRTPNNYGGSVVANDLEIEDREVYQLKQSLGIC